MAVGEKFDGFQADESAQGQLAQEGGLAKRQQGGSGESNLSAYSPHDQQCFEAYILHRDGGYTFDSDGRLGALTKQERKTFFRGFEVHQELEAKNNRESQGQDKAGQTVSPGDEQAFQKFADETKDQPAPRHGNGAV